MKQLIQFQLKNGESVLIEADVPEESGIVPSSRGVNMAVIKAQQTLEDALENVKPAAEAILTKLKGITDPPDEVEVTFSLKVSAEAGVFVASGSLEANYAVKMSWSKQ